MSERALGEAIAELLAASGPTGYSIRDVDAYRADTSDEETQRIRELYLPPARKKTTATMARRFQRAQISYKDGQKSWRVVLMRYDPKQKLDRAGDESRVDCAHSLAALGAKVLDLMAPEE